MLSNADNRVSSLFDPTKKQEIGLRVVGDRLADNQENIYDTFLSQNCLIHGTNKIPKGLLEHLKK